MVEQPGGGTGPPRDRPDDGESPRRRARRVRTDGLDDRLVPSASDGELDHVIHERHPSIAFEPVGVEEQRELAGSCRWRRQTLELGDVVVVELDVEPRHLGELPHRIDGPRRVPVDEGRRHPVPSEDVPGPEIAVAEHEPSTRQRPGEPRRPHRIRARVERRGQIVEPTEHFAEANDRVLRPGSRVRARTLEEGELLAAIGGEPSVVPIAAVVLVVIWSRRRPDLPPPPSNQAPAPPPPPGRSTPPPPT